MKLALALGLTIAVALLEFWGGFASHSIALTTDAVHVCMDGLALAVALIAAVGAARKANRRKTFGYGRLEVLAAVFNGALLLGATVVLAYQAFHRFSEPIEPHGMLMTVVAAIGFIVNVTIGLTLSHGHHHDLNVRAALAHVLGDALGAASVIIGGIFILATHAAWIDPLLSLFVAVIIVIGVARVLREAADVLLEGTPRDVNTAELRNEMCAIGGVADIHDLHVWAIGSGSRILTAHVLLDDRRISEGATVLERLRELASERYGIGHVTVQFEAEHCDPGGIVICQPES